MAIALSELKVMHCGVLEYQEAWQLQRSIHDRVADDTEANTLILVEHPSVFTAGRRTDSLERPTDGTPVIDVDRGGRITWHGPGQLVGYPIIKLAKRNEVVGFVRQLEEALIKTIAEFGLSGTQISGKTGVWLKDESGERKVAAIGVRVAKGVTMHGFALNVCPDLSFFDRIVPCGMPEAITTSMQQELGRPITIAEVTPVLEKYMLNSLSQVASSSK
mgnify:FL=1